MIKKYSLTVIIFLLFVQYYTANAQTELKFNVATAVVLVPNFGVEIPVNNRFSVQLDVLGSFWDSVNGDPYQIVQVFPEVRYYLSDNRQGFFVGAHVGFGMFTLQKPSNLVIFDPFQDPNAGPIVNTEGDFRSGRATFYGATIGYKKRFNDRWGAEVFIGAGYTDSVYKGFSGLMRTDVTEENFRDFNASSEFVLYRGGIMLIYMLK